MFRLTLRSTASLVFATALSACSCEPEKVPPPGPARCELDVMTHPELFKLDGEGAVAAEIAAPEEAIGGQFAAGSVGDFLLRNDRIRAVVSKPGRDMSHNPYGGALVDADLTRAEGAAGKDALGKLGLIYSFGRAIDVQRVEVLRDGSQGGPAVIAATGLDALNDLLTLKANIDKAGLGIKLVVDPEQPQPLRATTYYVLSPGDDRVRMATAFCNDGDKGVLTLFGEISAGGGTMDFFTPEQCKGTLGEADCLVDPSPWFGWQGDGVAYGFRTYQAADPTQPDVNAIVYLSGSAAVMAGTKDLAGIATWANESARTRPGAVMIRPGESALYLRDLVVGRDLAQVSGRLRQLDRVGQGAVAVTVTRGGQALPGARVAIEHPSTGRLVSLAVTDDQGLARAELPPGAYRLRTAQLGHVSPQPLELTVAEGQTATATLDFVAARKLTLRAKDPSGAPLAAKAVVRCRPGPCPTPSSGFEKFEQLEVLPDDVARIVYLLPGVPTEVSLSPGEYEVMLTHGPEYSAWPDTVPVAGQPVDLRTADAVVEGVLARVVDSAGWMSADLHVHAVNSADASPSNEARVMSFAAEQVEVLVATDHEFVTDYAPLIQALQLSSVVRSVVGTEVSPSYSHHNLFPLVHDGSFSGGAFDWAAGTTDPSYRPPQLYEAIRAQRPGAVIQLNHPRGTHGLFTNMKVDTLTSASHSDPARDRMEPAPDATANDTKLFSTGFDLMEVVNGMSSNWGVMNDWMTFLSRGIVRTGTAVSDTHSAYSSPAGYSRTFVQVGADDPGALPEGALIDALKAGRAFGTNGPYLHISAQRLDSSSAPVGAASGLGQTVALGAGEKLRFDVTVQAPEWMQFDRIELYTHADGREAWNGEANNTWPTTRIHQSTSLDPAALPVEVVPGTGALTFRRVKVTHSFEVTPTKDAWYVVIVRSTSAARDLFPLAFRTSCQDGACKPSNHRAFAFSNPILVDADGSGAYDDFALKATQPLRSPPPPPPPPSGNVPSLPELEAALREALHHDH